MHEIQNVLILIACVAILSPVATRLGMAEPILFVLGGLVLGLLPHFPALPLDPEVIFFLFLPPLLFLQAYFTSWREFRRNLRPIGLLAVGLVLFTSAGVAVLCRLLIPGMSLAEGFVLGGIVSPPDAVAVAAVARRLRLPRRLVVILEGESLVNDASGLVVLKFALAALATGHFSASEASLRFLWVAAGGVGIGMGLGWALSRIFHRIEDDSLAVLVSLLVPFAAYFPAEHLGVSGVLAYQASQASRAAAGRVCSSASVSRKYTSSAYTSASARRGAASDTPSGEGERSRQWLIAASMSEMWMPAMGGI